MASSAAGAARGSLYRQYSRGSSGGSISVENLPPRTLARVAREIRDLQKSPPEGVKLVVDSETGVPSSLGEVLVSVVGLDRFAQCHFSPGVHLAWSLPRNKLHRFRVRVPKRQFSYSMSVELSN